MQIATIAVSARNIIFCRYLYLKYNLAWWNICTNCWFWKV